MKDKEQTQKFSLSDFNKQCIKATAFATIVQIFTKKIKELSYKIGDIDEVDIEKININQINEVLDSLIEQILGDIDESVIRNC